MGVDKAGIVAKVSRCLADRDINIREMNSQSRPQAETGTPIYTMRMLLDVPKAATNGPCARISKRWRAT